MAGTATISGRYRTDVGPLDAARLLQGGEVRCEANPADPKRIKVYLHDNPAGTPTSDLYLEFARV